MQKLREQERIRSGKELQAAERENKMNELKRNVEYRKREKEQDAIARAKIKARLGGFAFIFAAGWPNGAQQATPEIRAGAARTGTIAFYALMMCMTQLQMCSFS